MGRGEATQNVECRMQKAGRTANGFEARCLDCARHDKARGRGRGAKGVREGSTLTLPSPIEGEGTWRGGGNAAGAETRRAVVRPPHPCPSPTEGRGKNKRQAGGKGGQAPFSTTSGPQAGRRTRPEKEPVPLFRGAGGITGQRGMRHCGLPQRTSNIQHSTSNAHRGAADGNNWTAARRPVKWAAVQIGAGGGYVLRDAGGAGDAV
jgi:hypothetical protein